MAAHDIRKPDLSARVKITNADCVYKYRGVLLVTEKMYKVATSTSSRHRIILAKPQPAQLVNWNTLYTKACQ